MNDDTKHLLKNAESAFAQLAGVTGKIDEIISKMRVAHADAALTGDYHKFHSIVSDCIVEYLPIKSSADGMPRLIMSEMNNLLREVKNSAKKADPQ